MSAPRKFDEETRARAVRLYQDRLRDHGESNGCVNQNWPRSSPLIWPHRW